MEFKTSFAWEEVSIVGKALIFLFLFAIVLYEIPVLLVILGFVVVFLLIENLIRTVTALITKGDE